MTMATLLEVSIAYALICVLAAMLLCAIRLLIGPAAHDRVLALDTLWMCGMLLAIVLGIRFGTQVYFEVAILVALVGFVSTIAMAKFLMRGEIIE
jgi:multicomponent K+:H+ antiporter subunit F